MERIGKEELKEVERDQGLERRRQSCIHGTLSGSWVLFSLLIIFLFIAKTRRIITLQPLQLQNDERPPFNLFVR